MDGVKEEVIEGDCTPWMDSGVVVKLEPAWSMVEDSPDQPSAVYSTVQPMSCNTSESLLSLKKGCVCEDYSAAFVLVSSLESNRASVHGKKLHMVLPGSFAPDRCDASNCSNTDIDKEVDSHGNRKTTKMEVDDDDTGDVDGKNRSRQHVCDVCKESFDNTSCLTKHKLTHSGAKFFVCDVCWKCFTQVSDLKRHMRTHEKKNDDNATGHRDGEGSERFVCDVCSKSFIHARNLTRHKRIHTGERPYKCPHCDGDFTHSVSLQHHVNSIHDGAKPHVCDVCGAAFSNIGNLTVHGRIHTGEKPHVCTDCGKGFATSSNLVKHHLTHSGEKPHSCPHCPYACTTLQNLKRHVVKKHQ